MGFPEGFIGILTVDCHLSFQQYLGIAVVIWLTTSSDASARA
jgi:hypothetical protein